SNDQFKLYKLIYERFLASQMAPAIMDTVTAHLSNNGIEFRANGSQVKFKGFMKVYVEGVDNKKQEDEGYLPELKEGEKVSAKDINQINTLHNHLRDTQRRPLLGCLKSKE